MYGYQLLNDPEFNKRERYARFKDSLGDDIIGDG